MEIKPYPKNAKEHTDAQLKKIKNSIKRFGWRQPITVNQLGVIITGHGRYLAWEKYQKELKLAWIMDDKGNTIQGAPETKPFTPEEEIAYRITDNKLNESEWIMELVVGDLKIISMELVDLTGFDSNLILETKEDKPDLSIVAGKPRSQLGDVYELGRHKIICGDSTDPATYEKLLGSERPRLVFTDPPYSIDYQSTAGMPDKFTGKKKKQYSYNSDKFGGSDGRIFNDDKTPEEALIFYKKILGQIYAFTTDDMTLYWWYANRLTDINMDAQKQMGFHFSQIILWLKNSLIFSPGQLFHRIYEPCIVSWKEGKTHYQNHTFSSYTELWNLDQKTFAENLDVIYQKRDNTNAYIHPTQKPVQLAERALKRSSEKGDIVLDAFGGSGSTMIACEQLDRSARLIELDPKFVDAIVGRYVKFKEDPIIVKNGEQTTWIV